MKESFIDCEFETYEPGDVVTIRGETVGGVDTTPHRWEIVWGGSAGSYGVRRVKDQFIASWHPWGDLYKSTSRGVRRLAVYAHTIPNTLTPRQRAAEAKRIAGFRWQAKGER